MTPVRQDNRSALDFLSSAGEMGRTIRQFNWSGHPLGDPAFWPQSLKTSLSLILNSQHPMWIGWGHRMWFLYNDAYLHVLGSAKHPWALGRPASEVWAEIWDVCGPLAERVFSEGQASFVDDVRLFMNRGDFLEETWYSFSYSPIRDESGKVGGLFCPSTDVTPKIIGARRLRTLSELAANALVQKTTPAASATAMATLGRNRDDIPFGLLYVAESDTAPARLQAAASLDGAVEEIAPSIIDVSGGSAGTTWPIAEVLSGGTTRLVSVARVQSLPRGPAGQPVNEAIVVPVASGPAGKPIGALVAGINPTRRMDSEYRAFFELVATNIGSAIQNARTMEEERKRADALAELDRAKTQFFSNISHEFRTPLTLMLGPLEHLLAKDSVIPQGVRDELETAHRNSLRLLKLVNSLLDFSRIEAGRVTGVFEPVDLAAITAGIASNFRSAMESAGLQFTVDCPPLARPVYADREMWEKIVLNLLSNAFKFTLTGGVSVRLAERNGAPVLTVSDTGVGIPENELPHIFERFHRVEATRGRSYEGTGIGLALIQELVKLHGGTIEAFSRIAEGSRFVVTIPYGHAHLPSEQVKHAVAAAAEPAGSRSGYSREALAWPPANISVHTPEEQLTIDANAGPKARILVADDNADMREYTKRILAGRYNVVSVADGRAALEEARRARPDLILSDVMMPNIDGFGLLSALRADPEMVNIPFIMFSARAGEEARSEGMEAGADDYLIKPFTARELMARVAAHLKLSKSRQEASARERSARAEAEALNEVSRVLSSELDLQKLIQTVTDIATRLTGAQFGAFFYNVTDEHGESYLLYSLSGAPREAFEKFGIMPRNTPIFHTTFSGLGPRRSDDIRKDPDYGKWPPHFGMPKGHLPVCSYLAVPVKSRSGEVLGGLFFGHPDAAVFTEASERLAAGIASHAAVAIDNARLYRKSEQQARASMLLASIVNSSDDAIVSKDLNGVVTSWNKSAEQLFGYTAQEAIGKTIAELIIPADRQDEEPEILSQLRSGKRVDHFETVRQRKDGTLVDVSLTISPLLDAQGRPTGASKIARDITTRKRAERASRLLGAIVDSTDDAIVSKDLNGVITSWNMGAERLFGYTPEEAIGKTVAELIIPPDRQDEEPEILARLRRGERVDHFETIRQRKDGSLLHVSVTISPIRNAQGKVIGASKIARDITPQIRARAEREKMENELRRANQDLEQFAYSASHDLQEPLRTVKIFSELLATRYGAGLAGEAQEFLANVRGGAHRMETLVRDLLTYTQAATVGADPDYVDANAAMRAAVANLAGAIAETGAAIDSGPLPSVRIHGIQLQQVFQNLIGNAVKYHRPGVPPVIHVTAKCEQGNWMFSVTDNGIGIEPQFKERIFGLFKRLHTGDEYSGTGIGLALCQRIVERHHGRIWVESEPGKGSTFRFTLPA